MKPWIKKGRNLHENKGKSHQPSGCVRYPGYNADLIMYLQRKGANGYWTTIESWSGSGSGISGVSLFESYSGLTKGTTYRVYAVANVYQNGAYVEQVTVSSQESTYQ
ncbi:MAG: hypothetical protein IMZ64_08780 [Bacteroidetes bacterium]|nr:hypothetical protein [Bacteroidota bacterium]